MSWRIDLQKDGSGTSTGTFITSPLYAMALREALKKDAAKTGMTFRESIRDGKHHMAAIFAFNSLSTLEQRINSFASGDTTNRFTVKTSRTGDRLVEHSIRVGKAKRDQALAFIGALVFRGKMFRYELGAPTGTVDPNPARLGDLEIDPSQNDNGAVWTIPMETLLAQGYESLLVSFMTSLNLGSSNATSDQSLSGPPIPYKDQGAARQTSTGLIEHRQENFRWPIEVPTFSGNPPNDYATFGVGKKGYFHAGVDIKSSNLPLDKTRVKAIANGIIEDIFRTSDTTTRCDGVTPFAIRTDNHGFGNTIILKHSDKLYSLYAHLHCVESKLEKGTSVSQGEPIGLMGNSAYEKRECNLESDCNPQSTEDRGFGKHLHLEIKKRGILTNPDGPADQYFAYTKDHPDKYGYLDPKKIIGPWPSTAALVRRFSSCL
ncbi:MAG: M23 family metallopeptidase [Gammaproteobacteria bacterium]